MSASVRKSRLSVARRSALVPMVSSGRSGQSQHSILHIRWPIKSQYLTHVANHSTAFYMSNIGLFVVHICLHDDYLK